MKIASTPLCFLLIFISNVSFSINLQGNIIQVDKKIDQSYVQGYTFQKVYDSPKGIALWLLDDNQKFYSVDSDQNFKQLMWGGGGSINDYARKVIDLDVPWGLACSTNAVNIYISDINSHHIIKYTRNSNGIDFYSKIGTYGTGWGQFNRPSGIAVRQYKKMDLLYVIEAGNNRLQAFLNDNLFKIDSDNFNCFNLNNSEPMGITIIVTDETNYKKDKIIVSDTYGNICSYTYNHDVINHSGNHILYIGLEKSLNLSSIVPNASLYGIAIDEYNHIFVVDNANTQIHILDQNLNYLFSYNMAADGIWSPWYIDIWKPTGRLALTWGGSGTKPDTNDGGGMVYWIGAKVFGLNTVNPLFSPLSPDQNTCKVQYRLFTPSKVTVTVEDQSGNAVAQIENEAYKDITSGDSFETVWNGLDGDGNPVTPGNYKIRIKADSLYGAYSSDEASADVSISIPLAINITGIDPSVIDSQNGTAVVNYGYNYAPVSMSAYVEKQDGSGWTIIRTLFQNSTAFTGSVSWNGKLDSGANAPDDVYRIRLTGKDNSGITSESICMVVVNRQPIVLLVDNPVLTVMNPNNPAYNNNSIIFNISKPAKVDIVIDDAAGNLKKTLQTGISCPAGDNNVSFDAGGLENGSYKVVVTATHVVTGNVRQGESPFSVDTIAPGIVINNLDNPYISPDEASSPNIKDSVSFSFTADENSTADVSIINNGGSIVKNIFQQQVMTPNNSMPLNWDGRDDSGNVVPDGDYRIFVKAVDSVGNVGLKYNKVVVDDNNSVENINYIASTSLIMNMTENDFNFYWSRQYKKYVWVNTNLFSIVLSGEDGNNIKTIQGSGSYTINGILSPKENFYGVLVCTNFYFNEFEEIICIYRFLDIAGENLSENELTNIYPSGKYELENSIYMPYSFKINQGIMENKIIFDSSWINYGNYNDPYHISIGIRDILNTSYEYFADYEDSREHSLDYPINIGFLTSSPDDNYIIWSCSYDYLHGQGQSLYIYNYSNGQTKSIPNMYIFIKWLDNTKFLGLMNNHLYEIDVASLNATDIGPINATPVELSFDGKLLLSTDGQNVYLYSMENKSTSFLYNFDSIFGFQNSVEPKKYELFFSQNGNYFLVYGIKNGVRGIYRVDITKTASKNLTASLDYPNSGMDHIEGVIQVRGSALDSNFDKYQLYYKLSTDGSWTKICESSSPVNQDVLGTLDTTAFYDGNFVDIKLSAYDKAGNVRESVTENKVINNVSYLLSAVSVNGGYLTPNNAIINYKLNDTADSVQITIKDAGGNTQILNNQPTTSGLKTINIGGSLNLLSDGRVTYSVVAVKDGKGITLGGDFILDKTPPAITIDNPTGTVTSNRQVDVTGTVNDANLSYYDILVNNSKVNTVSGISGGSVSGKLASIDLPDEITYTVTVKAYDKAGNSFDKSINIIADRTPPICLINSPVQGEGISKTLKANGSITDPNPDKFDLYLNDNKIYTGNRP